jgi:GGDEF domain-containing protein
VGQLAERLRHAVSTSWPTQEVTASIGVALAGTDAVDDVTDSLWKLIDRADAAMYEAKRAGRDRVTLAGCPAADRRRDPAADSV